MDRAVEAYAVVFDEAGAVDQAATARLRAQRANAPAPYIPPLSVRYGEQHAEHDNHQDKAHDRGDRAEGVDQRNIG